MFQKVDNQFEIRRILQSYIDYDDDLLTAMSEFDSNFLIIARVVEKNNPTFRPWKWN